MTASDILTILAILLSPLIAVQVQKTIERWQESGRRKSEIFKTLMATRGIPLSPRHVEALNMIDLEFSGRARKEKLVVDSWKVYRDHLNDAPRDLQDTSYQVRFDAWVARSGECLADLLYSMAQSLGYDFDKVHLKKGAYTPQGYADLDLELSLIRRGTLNLLTGRKPLPIEVANLPRVQSNEGTATSIPENRL